VISTVVAVAVPGGADTAFWAAAELANGDNQRFLEESALVEVFEEC
jgi:hypothetical protein